MCDKHDDIQKIVDQLRTSTLIKERVFGNISSFNFTRKAFYSSAWNELTVRARGMFIDTVENRIVARGYDKFFNVGENKETSIECLGKKMMFPLSVYQKENGFLGMISFNAKTNDLFFATKSMCDGPYVDMLKKIFYIMDDVNVELVKSILHDLDATMLVEVIDPVNDPHIIEYEKAHIVLLDVVKNTWKMQKVSYEELLMISDCVHIPCKELYSVIRSWDEFEEHLNDWNRDDFVGDNGTPIEGFVVEDAAGYMVKDKTAYYKMWKQYRWKSDKAIHSSYQEDDPFLVWVNEKIQGGANLDGLSIIDLRNMYEEDGHCDREIHIR